MHLVYHKPIIIYTITIYYQNVSNARAPQLKQAQACLLALSTAKSEMV